MAACIHAVPSHPLGLFMPASEAAEAVSRALSRLPSWSASSLGSMIRAGPPSATSSGSSATNVGPGRGRSEQSVSSSRCALIATAAARQPNRRQYHCGFGWAKQARHRHSGVLRHDRWEDGIRLRLGAISAPGECRLLGALYKISTNDCSSAKRTHRFLCRNYP
jgi:hypothetical protein